MGEKSEHTSRMLIKGVKKHSTREEKRPVCVCVCVGVVVVGPLGQEDQGRPHWEGDLSGVAEL